MRGLNDNDKKDLVKCFLKDRKCDLLCLQHKKLEDVQLSNIHGIWGNGSVEFAALKAIGSADSISGMWYKNSFHLASSSCGDFSVRGIC